MLALVFDTETTGLPDFRKPPMADTQPHLVQLAWVVIEDGRVVAAESSIVLPEDWEIPDQAAAIHGITQAIARRHGTPASSVLWDFATQLMRVRKREGLLVAHNIQFDAFVLTSAFGRQRMTGLVDALGAMKTESRMRCTMAENVGVVDSRFEDGRPGKWPKLTECHAHYFGAPHESQHDALGDVQACARIFQAMERGRAQETQPAVVGGA